MSIPTVSVAMVVCNMEPYVGESIESILNQSFRDFEFVIVDFGSTDNTAAIVAKYRSGDGRIRFHTVPSCGLAEARNASCFLARGRYIALMDADDVAFPDRLERQVDFLEKHPEIGLVGGALECIGPAGSPRYIREYFSTDAKIRESLRHGNAFAQNTILMRKEVMTEVKGYRKAFAVGEDYDLWLRIAERYQVANLREPVVCYRLHSDQVGVRKLRHEVMNCLAAQAAARQRAQGGADTLGDVTAITPEVLESLGVSRAALTQALAQAYGDRINTMLQVANDDVVLSLAGELVELARSGPVNHSILSSACLSAARIQFKRGAYLAALRSTLRAGRARPVIIGRPVKNLVRRGLAALKPGPHPRGASAK